MRVYGGLYEPDKENLLSLREGIAADIDGFKQLYSNKEFESVFGVIRGDQNKIIPKELKPAGAIEPLIYNKQFYYFSTLEPNAMCGEDFMEQVLHKYQVGRPIEQYFSKIINR